MSLGTSVRNEGVTQRTLTAPSSVASPSADTGKLTGRAAGTPTLAGMREASQPAATSPALQQADTALAAFQSGSKLSVRKEFDAESRTLTKNLFNALDNTLRTARDHFDRECRLPAYAKFKQVRDGSQETYFGLPKDDANRQVRDSSQWTNGDSLEPDPYETVGKRRVNNAAARSIGTGIDEGDGRSDLEKLLPANSSFRRLLEPATGSIRDVKTGLNADLSRLGDPPVYRLVFPGTGLVDTTGTQLGVSIRQFLGIGGVPAAYQDALKLAKEIKANLPEGATLELGGHSLGGGIATYVGLKLGLKAVGFNSAMLGPACMRDLRKEGCLTSERLASVHQVRIEGDAVSSRKANKLLVALTSFGLLFPSRVPRLLGQVHQISEGNAAHPKCGPLERHLPDAFYAAYDRK